MVGCGMFVVFKRNLNISFSILFDFFNEASSYRKKRKITTVVLHIYILLKQVKRTESISIFISKKELFLHLHKNVSYKKT